MRLGSFETPARERLVGELVGDRVHRLEAPTMSAWLAGEGRNRTGEELDVGELHLLAPVPEPPSVRDFYAYEGHVAAGARLRGREIAPHGYEAPAGYFSNPASILGPGESLSRPVTARLAVARSPGSR